MEKICNGCLEASFASLGAEMMSLRDAESGRELLWNGDARYWNRRSPILFPIVGGLWNGVCRIGGRELRIPKHGFLREKEWTLVRREERALAYACEAGEREKAVFPFDFRVEVSYELSGRSLTAGFRVENPGTDTLWFQMGGHPGFLLPDFDEQRPVSGYARPLGECAGLLRAGEQGCTEPRRVPVPADERGWVPLCRDTFAHEALIFDGGCLSGIELLRADGSRLATVEGDAPVWLLWSPQGEHAPFVCVEPWYGLCDEIGFEGDVSRRPYINRLAPGGLWQGGFRISV